MTWKRVLAWSLMLGVFSGQAEASEELLEAAADFGNEETVKRLLATGADINYQDENGRTALIIATEHSYSLDNMKPLLEAGADVHLQDKDGDTALLTAAYGGDEMGASEDGREGRYPYADAVDWLLAAGADINHQNKDGRTALMIAVRQGFGDTVLVGRLLAAGADVNRQDKDGRTALHLAADMGDRVNYQDMCGSGGCGSEPNPVNNGYPETLKRLLAAGADVNRQDKDGRTALHLAAQWGYINAVKSLLAEPGVELHLQDKDGHTVFQAVSSSDTVTTELLRDANNPAEATGQQQAQESPTHVTAERRRTTQLPREVRNSLGIELVLIEPGTFEMGSPITELERGRHQPPYRVTISQPYYLGKYEVTQAQWQAVMGDNPSGFSDCDATCPVEQVSWEDAQRFIDKLNAREGVKSYRLPTEAEWEYAARAGTRTAYPFGDDTIQLGACAWYWDNADRKTHPVGQKRPNEWGLFDMHGNVWEWVQDWYGHYPPRGAATDPRGSRAGPYRVFRGGSWDTGVRRYQAAARNRFWPSHRYNDLGFRLARTP